MTNKVWSFDLNSHEWDVHDSGIEGHAQGTAVAFDAEKQVGWYYGGFDRPDQYYNGAMYVDFASIRSTETLQDLYHLGKGKGTPIKVETDSSLVGKVENGELVYIGGVGEAGILVLIGGNAGVQSTQLVSTTNQINKLCHSLCPFD